jgi:lysozyme family protein
MKEFFTKIIQAIMEGLFGKISDATAAKTEAEPLSTAVALEGPVGASFDVAANYTAVDEGGYVNNPNDSGGPTNYGITQATLARYRGKAVNAADVKALTKKEARLIYKKFYWDVLHLDNVGDQNVATVIFNLGMLCGTGMAAKWMQEIGKVKVDLKVGDKTLTAVNSMKRSEFIPAFVNKARARFAAIIKANAKNKVFEKGWENRAKDLMKLAEPSEPIMQSPPSLGGGKDIGAGLVELAVQNGFSSRAMQDLIEQQKNDKPESNPRYWALFEISRHSKFRRFALIDRYTMTLTPMLVAHGKMSDPDFDGLATIFSNKNGSNCSSLGLYRFAETYEMSGHGRACRLDGLSSTNSNARARGVVFHGAAAYVSDAYVKKNGKCGRSLGCPAVDDALVQDAIDKLRDGSLMNIYTTV